MILFFEKQLRRVIREELERFMELPHNRSDSYHIKSLTGGEIIMPSPIKELFDEGRVTSIKDIIY